MPSDLMVSRLQQPKKFGGVWNGNAWIMNDFNVHSTELICSTDSEFAGIVANIKKEIQRRITYEYTTSSQPTT